MNSDDKKYTLARIAIFALLVLGAVILVAWLVIGEGEPPSGPAPDTTLETPASPAAPDTQEVDAALTVPSFDVVRISRGGTGVIAGRAGPGDVVDILADGATIGTETADANGEWVLILIEPLQSGTLELSLVAHTGGGETVESEDIVVISLPERPGRDRFVESDTSGVVAVLQPRDGEGPSRVLQKPGSAPVGEIAEQLTVDTLDYDADGRAIISGRAVPRARLALYLDNQFIGQVRADDQGRWTLRPSAPVEGGDHILRIDQVVEGGDVQLRIEQPFTTGVPIDPGERTGMVVVQPGNNLWHIARSIYGSGVRYTLIFQENREQIRDPDLIYPGQLFELPPLGRN